jgi:hypothetical protein
MTKHLVLITCFLLSLFPLYSQTSPKEYNKKWLVVDSLVKRKGLTESALTEVNKIFVLATNEHNSVQQIKALVYRLNLANQRTENSEPAAITELEKAIVTANQPAKAILQNIVAGAYLNYYHANRNTIFNRSNTEGFKKEDIATWSSADLKLKITTLFLTSLKDEIQLSQLRLDDYDPILVEGNVRDLRPTLFDILAHSALDYFISGEQELDKPEEIFEITDPAAFAEAEKFSTHYFASPDSGDLHFLALKLYQRLIQFHQQDSKRDALIDVDIQRLDFVHANSVLEDKEELFTVALEQLARRWPKEPAVAQAWYLIASQHEDKAARYNSLQDTAGRFEYQKAKAICEFVMQEPGNSEGKSNCDRLLKQISARKLQVEMETVNLPGQPFLSLVKWRNIGKVYYRVLNVDPATQDKMKTYLNNDNWKFLAGMPVLRTFTQVLPETNDYQEHRAEIRIDALPVGDYAILASSDSAFVAGQNSSEPMVVTFFHVSAISFINDKYDYFVVDRESGQPLRGATVQVWEEHFDNQKSGLGAATKAESYRTDEQGHFLLKKRPESNYGQPLSLDIHAGNDHLYFQTYPWVIYSYERQDSGTMTKERYEREHRQGILFTDRSIYRPGQTVFFKGIVLTRNIDTRQLEVLTNFDDKVYLYDANQNVVDSLTLATNNFGSYHGQFRLPEHLLNGVFSIRGVSSGSWHSLSVEEYKRPRFFVGFDTLRTNYRLGDSIRVTGQAKAFSGNQIDGALVKYRVIRQAHYFYPCPGCTPLRTIGGGWAGWGPIRRQTEQEVAHGTAKTDRDGKFHIDFLAIADKSIDKETDPVFEFTVSADVTDIGGETRSGQSFVQAGYRSIHLTIDQPAGEHLPSDSFTRLVVSAANLSGVPEPTVTELSIYSLQSLERMIRPRYWQAPDQFILSKEDFLRSFPHDEYGDETNKEKWATTGKVFGVSDSTGKPVIINSGTGLPPGWYRVEARAKDKDGELVKTSRFIELYDGSTGKPVTPQYLWSQQPDPTLEPGERAVVEIGSSVPKLFVIRKIDGIEVEDHLPLPEKAVAFKFFTLENGKERTEIPVTEGDRGGFGVSDIFVRDNRIFTQDVAIRVPWSNKDLDIRYSSFRDKTLPGSKEKWGVHIGGQHGQKLTAEALAGMYDASLDEFKPQSWSVPQLNPVFQMLRHWFDQRDFGTADTRERYISMSYPGRYYKQYDRLLGLNMGSLRPVYRMALSRQEAAPVKSTLQPLVPGKPHTIQIPDFVSDPDASKGLMRDSIISEEGEQPLPAFDRNTVQPRKDFRETAFFFPDLLTDSAGNVSFSFTMPEALTSWKWMTLAHTRDLAFGYGEKTVITQKQLMVQPNAPRFLREGDRMELPVKVVNLTDSEMTGQVHLVLTDPTTGQTADGWFTNRQANQFFTVPAHGSIVAGFPLDIPYQYNRPLTYSVTAEAKNYSDGEEATLPVVSNRMLVTESLPLNMPGDGTKQFRFEKLLKSGSSETLSQHALTVEFAANPAWYAVQSLPYLMEYPYECAEQVFNRAYANALATTIVSKTPRLRQVFDQWRTADTAALLSNLQKNQELKSVLLEETPWVLQGKSEEQQKKNIAILFDIDRMSRELGSAIDKLSGMQSPSGGFAWFRGGLDDRYITQYILTGIGRLRQLKALSPSLDDKTKTILAMALPWLDGQLKKEYADLLTAQKRKGARPLSEDWVSPVAIEYLYMRSFFNDQGIPGNVLPAVSFYRKQAQKNWVGLSNYLRGMVALALFRTGDVQTAKDILASLKQNAIVDEEKGMYWKGMETGGYYWYQAPVETEALLIEAFREIGGDAAADRGMKTWLLRQKQTHHWATTKATADACYALMLGGQEWLNAERNVVVKLGDKTIDWPAGSGDAGMGYNKKVFDGPFVNPSMGNITITMKTKGSTASATAAAGGKQAGGAGVIGGGSPAWGAVYWQYFDMLERITPAGQAKAALSIEKKLFVSRNSDRGPVLEPLADNGSLKPGDKVVVRMVIRADRSMEYVHLKDMRGACFEPVNVISQYKWQDGLGYYESTKDASTDFFFGWLPKGTHVFEYTLFAGQTGNFSNGVTMIECMYAPEFAYHSEGIRVNVEAAR